MPDRPAFLRADTKIIFRKVVVLMKSKKASSGDVPVPGRSWKQNKITCKADVMLSGDAAGWHPAGDEAMPESCHDTAGRRLSWKKARK